MAANGRACRAIWTGVAAAYSGVLPTDAPSWRRRSSTAIPHSHSDVGAPGHKHQLANVSASRRSRRYVCVSSVTETWSVLVLSQSTIASPGWAAFAV